MSKRGMETAEQRNLRAGMGSYQAPTGDPRAQQGHGMRRIDILYSLVDRALDGCTYTAEDRDAFARHIDAVIKAWAAAFRQRGTPRR